jgi:hypothetical protein
MEEIVFLVGSCIFGLRTLSGSDGHRRIYRLGRFGVGMELVESLPQAFCLIEAETKTFGRNRQEREGLRR